MKMNKEKVSTANEYNPLNDKTYMSPQMLCYFTDKLKNLQHQILQKEREISNSIMDDSLREPDHVDRGIKEEYNFNQFSFQAHEDELLKEIDQALKRIEEGTYGYCQETGEEIGIKRLELIPYTKYSVKVQAQKEEEAKRFL